MLNNMKYKLLSIRGEHLKESNIGDYIQALASSQFLPSIDGFVNREELNSYAGEECKMIMNAWYIHNSNQWPPSDKINPLFVAVHFNSSVIDKLLSDESIAYLKKFAPIGCRDYYTVEHLKNKGVDAYFSACMTLTLGYKYKSEVREDKCYFVDPTLKIEKSFGSLCKTFFYMMFNLRSINIIARKYPKAQNYIKKCLKMAVFYREYSRFFSKETLLNAEYICQQDEYYKTNFVTDEERLSEAERLVNKYAKASLVVTSRIHCALPCLGLETPVIFTDLASQNMADTCRLGGLRELFTVIAWKDGELVPEFKFNGKLSIKNVPKNKDNWRVYAEHLKTICMGFMG